MMRKGIKGSSGFFTFSNGKYKAFPGSTRTVWLHLLF